jgi:excisionase family DNA binding protein
MRKIVGQKLDRFLTVRETARMLHIHPNTLRRWGDKGLLKVWRITPSGDRRFSKEDVLSIIDNLYGQNTFGTYIR